MAKSDKSKPSASDDIKPAEGFSPAATFGDESPVHEEESAEIDPRDAEILRLRAELAEARGKGSITGGKFTVSIKDGPTATIEAKPGESAADAFMRACGIHATPHRPEIHDAAPDAVCGIHLPNGTVKPFATA